MPTERELKTCNKCCTPKLKSEFPDSGRICFTCKPKVTKQPTIDPVLSKMAQALWR